LNQKKKQEELVQKLLRAIVAGSVGAAFFIFLIYAMKGRSKRSSLGFKGRFWPPASPSPPIPPPPPPMYPSPPPRPPYVARNITEELEQKLLLSNLHAFEANHRINKRFTGHGVGKDELLLSKDQWKVMKPLMDAARAEKMQAQQRPAQAVMNKAGRWYWGRKSTQKMLKEGVLYSENDLKLSGTGLSGRKDLCYWNETKRAQDYYEPIPGNWTFLPKVLPIYAHYDCFADKQMRADVMMPKFNCHDAAQAQQCGRLRFEGRDCATIPLDPSKLIYFLRDRTIWFFGDFHSKQQFKALKCTLWESKIKQLHIPKTGYASAEAWEFKNNVRLVYVLAGLHKDAPRWHHGKQVVPEDSLKKANANDPTPKAGLTAEFMASHGLSRTAGMDIETQEWAGVKVGIYPLDEQLDRFMPDYKPWDLIVANIGQEFSEARVYQRHLLNFLKLYDDKKDQMPILFWRETPAQHHDPTLYKGGDILAPILRDFLAPPPPVVSRHGRQPDPWMAHLETIQCKDVPFAVHRDNNWRNDLANRLVETAQIPVLRVWESSTRRHDWYSRRCESGYCDRFGPCMHYCNPGAVTQWNEMMRTMLEAPTIQRAWFARLPVPPPPPSAPDHPPLPPGVVVVPEVNDLWEAKPKQEPHAPETTQGPPAPEETLASELSLEPPPPLHDEHDLYPPPSPPVPPPLPDTLPPGMLAGGLGIVHSPPPHGEGRPPLAPRAANVSSLDWRDSSPPPPPPPSDLKPPAIPFVPESEDHTGIKRNYTPGVKSPAQEGVPTMKAKSRDHLPGFSKPKPVAPAAIPFTSRPTDSVVLYDENNTKLNAPEIGTEEDNPDEKAAKADEGAIVSQDDMREKQEGSWVAHSEQTEDAAPNSQTSAELPADNKDTEPVENEGAGTESIRISDKEHSPPASDFVPDVQRRVVAYSAATGVIDLHNHTEVNNQLDAAVRAANNTRGIPPMPPAAPDPTQPRSRIRDHTDPNALDWHHRHGRHPPPPRIKLTDAQILKGETAEAKAPPSTEDVVLQVMGNAKGDSHEHKKSEDDVASLKPFEMAKKDVEEELKASSGEVDLLLGKDSADVGRIQDEQESHKVDISISYPPPATEIESLGDITNLTFKQVGEPAVKSEVESALDEAVMSAYSKPKQTESEDGWNEGPSVNLNS